MARRAHQFDADTPIPGYLLGKVLGISGQAVGKLARNGVLLQDSQRLYPLASSVQAYLAFRTRGQREPDTSSEPKTLDSEELRLKSAKADLAELELGKRRRDLIPVEEILPTATAIMSTLRTNILARDIQIARDGALLEEEELQPIVRRHLIECLSDLSAERVAIAARAGGGGAAGENVEHGPPAASPSTG